jgi:hypothetical protein
MLTRPLASSFRTVVIVVVGVASWLIESDGKLWATDPPSKLWPQRTVTILQA